MKELLEIVQGYKPYLGQPLCLATVINTRGSTYRKAGARMLIAGHRQTIGSISGGCLEADVIAHAEKAWRDGETLLLTYDTTSQEDLLLGVGMGCNGIMEVLLEPILPGNTGAGLLELIEKTLQNRAAGIIATAIVPEQPGAPKSAHRLMLDEDGTLHGGYPDAAGERVIFREMTAALEQRHSNVCILNQASGAAEVFLEYICAPPPLFIFGAGYDAMPMARMAKEVGWAVTVVDHRPAFATRERFPEADALLVGPPESLELSLDDRAAAIVMSHNYIIDQHWLRRLLPRELRYLGLMGPRSRAGKMIQELQAEGLRFSPDHLSALYNPVGLDIGAESPEQIALAILGEIQAVFAGHGGGLLRDKKGGIHSTRQPGNSEPAGVREEVVPCPASA